MSNLLLGFSDKPTHLTLQDETGPCRCCGAAIANNINEFNNDKKITDFGNGISFNYGQMREVHNRGILYAINLPKEEIKEIEGSEVVEIPIDESNTMFIRLLTK